jgi:hypothetical protein
VPARVSGHEATHLSGPFDGAIDLARTPSPGPARRVFLRWRYLTIELLQETQIDKLRRTLALIKLDRFDRPSTRGGARTGSCLCYRARVAALHGQNQRALTLK